MRIMKASAIVLLSLGASLGCAPTAAESPQTASPAAPPQSAPAAPASREPDVPYVPTPDAVVAEMLRIANVTKDDVLYDLGSGDGRIVITAAEKFGTRGIGIDINPVRVKEANENAARAKVTDRVKFVEQDLFETDIREATVVTLYLLPEINMRLRPKLWKELKPGTRVVSHSFDMGDWTPDKTVEVDGRRIHFWVIPKEPPSPKGS
jgi:precorrin-6B methylase 2